MCLIIFGWQTRTDLPLVVAANRDEFHQRPAVPAHFWPEQPALLAGRDLSAGGTWMGVTRDGRFAALTNYRDPDQGRVGVRTRGELAVEFLSGSADPVDYLRALSRRADQYAGFSLLVGTPGQLACYSNAGPPEAALQALPPGIYGLSNALLDTPWPKVVRGKRVLASLLQGQESPDHDSLGQVVSDRSLASSEALHPLGLGESMDRTLSAQFILTPTYGTRSTTTLWLEQQARGLQVNWRELGFDAGGGETGRCEWRFPCPGTDPV